MTEPTRVRDLFLLPNQVRKGDFVLKLTEGIEQPKETASTYVVTKALVASFDQALRLVGSALRDGRSQAAYLHGSFGSGKSHFMALLTLLLQGQEDAWRIPTLHALREPHGFIGKKKLLQLHFHMVGQDSIEAAVFGRYVDHVRQHHPDATVPGLFADEQLFADARRMLEELGDARFFGPMNDGVAPGAGWGELSKVTVWSRERFEEAATSADPKVREQLFSALVKTRFKAYAHESRAFVDLDSGLGTMARHAAGLGYEGIVLFLDELILWLAHRASEAAWLHNETQKMVKLVEAQEAQRPIPIISFIARQRNLAEMVGAQYAGAETARLHRSLEHWEGRYDTIALEDRDLPAILEKRVLKHKDDAARRLLDDAFEKLKRASGASWQTLLGRDDATAFRLLYPFSPVLVEALVALSNSLQRERTAIKLLLEILVEHIEDLRLGDVVGVGDLFDVLSGGDDPADGVMKARFEAAKQIYRYQFLPMIQEGNGTTTPDRCQRLRPGHPVRLGCSNCPEKACRLDNRLIKTLIVAALVPEIAAFKEVTASKLAQLNHGTLRVPIPGAEATIVAQKLRTWGSTVGQLHVGTQADPVVRLVLEGVDLTPILQQAREHDTPGGRQRVIRDLLFEAMGVDKIADWGKDRVQIWRGTKRPGHLRFGNVRKLGDEQLLCPADDDWRLVVDYPFDEKDFGPNDDLRVLDELVEKTHGTWTLAWIPSFFSRSINDLLGELVVIEHLLENKETERQAVAHLSVENQARALLDLRNLRSQKTLRLIGALEQAYGLSRAKEGDLDPSRSVENHLRLLMPGATLQPTLAANLTDALDAYIPAVLAARYPRHPHFAPSLTGPRIVKLVEKFGEIIDAEDKRIAADRDLYKEMSGTLSELGLVRVTETAVHLVEDRTLQELEKKRSQKAVDIPTVGQIRSWIDESNKMGLQVDALDLIVRCYARWAARTLVRFDKPFEPKAGQEIPDDVVLEKPPLPGHADWARALVVAGDTFGIALAGKALHADNLKRFESLLAEKLAAVAAASAKLPSALRARLVALGEPETADRLRTAITADRLCASLQKKSGLEQVNLLAGATFDTSAKAVGRSMGSAAETVSVLDNALVFGVFAQLQARRAELAGAQTVNDNVAQALRQDEVNEALAPRLRALAEEGQRLLAPPLVFDISGGGGGRGAGAGAAEVVLFQKTLEGRGREAVLASLRALLADVEGALDAAGDDVRVHGTVTLAGKKKG
ncbi:hypothetical protein WMF28_15305 [Sorangium sp. So ce590]|uniref:hypothetical protein n=1 Tax=Sorangium sp. So ce590 TaxID=3133317 RepID=UPI003F5DA348